MNKTFLVVSRFIFVGVFLVTSLTLMAWEIYQLMDIEPVIVKAVGSELAIGQGAEVALAADDEQKTVVTSTIVADDARPLIIYKYLEKYHSPLLPYSELIYRLSIDYGVGYDWILAIGQQESNLCKKIPEGSFNCFGYGITSKSTLRFENYETMLKSYVEYLDREYFAKGLNTEELIMKKYCPHSNGSWAYGVKHFREEINNGVF